MQLVLAGILLPGSAWATEITRADASTGAIDNPRAGVFDVYAQRIAADRSVGINQFSKFSLDQDHIANMFFNKKAQNVNVV